MAGRGLRLAFFGTPEFAVPTLQALCSAGRAPLLVVSQPDRPAGRGRTLQQPPVAQFASRQGLDLAQPERVRDPEFSARVAALELDVAVVVAFGQIFPESLLGIPRHGCVNVHASLLPRHRGAAPIQAAIRSLDSEAGVCTMLMEAGLDSGPVLDRAATTLHGRETAGELSARLSFLGASLLLETLASLEAAGSLSGTEQNHELASYAPRLTKADGRIDWGQPSVAVDGLVRAMNPWPGAQTTLRGETVKVLLARPAFESGNAGELLRIDRNGIVVGCGEGSVELLEVQRSGKRPMAATDLANGLRLEVGESLL